MNRSGIFGSNSSSGSLYSGALTTEQKQKWDRQFDVADTNGDGLLDAAEGQVREHLAAALPEPAPQGRP